MNQGEPRKKRHPQPAARGVAGEALPPLTYMGAPAAARKGFRFDESASGRNSMYWANGTGSFVKTDSRWILRLHDDFKAGPGPNFRIALN